MVKLIQSYWQALYPTFSRLYQRHAINISGFRRSACAMD